MTSLIAVDFKILVMYQGCQMVYFQTKNPDMGKFYRLWQWKMLVYFIAVWSILRPFGIFCGHLVYFMVSWYDFPVLVYCTKKNLATLLRTYALKSLILR
jgi:uncharacterized Tic20 family protein